MAYRNFVMPDFARGSHDVTDWIVWLSENAALVPVAPRPAASCQDCQGAVGELSQGGYFTYCRQCNGYGDYVDLFVPITYSLDRGLESMLHRFKDWEGYEWLRYPLGSLLYTFLTRHQRCIETAAQGIDIAAFVPSNDRTRDFSQLDLIATAVQGSPVLDMFPWDHGIIRRDFDLVRPRRGELKPAAYAIDEDAVQGKSVLLFDDTWTSGSTIASSAMALKLSGAARVTALTLGRQLNMGGHFGSTDVIFEDVKGRGWRPDECVLCS